jgi:hypothetical protein
VGLLPALTEESVLLQKFEPPFRKMSCSKKTRLKRKKIEMRGDSITKDDLEITIPSNYVLKASIKNAL